MPQLSQIGEIYASQLFWLAIVFAAIYFGIGKAMVPRIEATIDDRNGRISSDLAAAEAARASARDSDGSYESGMDTARAGAAAAVAEARARATERAEAQLKANDATMAGHLATAIESIAASKTAAVGEIEVATADAVEQIVAKLSGVAVDRPAIEARVKAELAHV